LFLMGDNETGSYWNHITGECIHGPLTGARLETGLLQQMTAEQTLTAYPEAQFALSDLSRFRRLLGRLQRFMGTRVNGFLPPGFRGTMNDADTRRPRMDMGLGVWTNKTHRYYALADIRAKDGLLLDKLNGRSLLIYIDPDSHTPTAVYSNATEPRWEGDVLHLDKKATIRHGLLFSPQDSQGQRLEQPQQLFTRWYGFAYTFPGCEIYGI